MHEPVTLTLPLSAVKRLATLRLGDLRLNDPLGVGSPVLQDWQLICSEAAKAVDAAADADLLPPSMRGVTPPAWFTAAPDDPFAEPAESDEALAERSKEELKALAQSFFDQVLRPVFKAVADGHADLRSRG